MEATDADIGMNGVIVYNITHGNEKSNFYVDRKYLFTLLAHILFEFKCRITLKRGHHRCKNLCLSYIGYRLIETYFNRFCIMLHRFIP